MTLHASARLVSVMIAVHVFVINNHAHKPANAKQQFPRIRKMNIDYAQIFIRYPCRAHMILKVIQIKDCLVNNHL